MEIQVSVHDWLNIPMETRLKLREIFKIPKSQGTWVENSIVRSDGTTHQDLQAVTIEKMQAFTESKEDDFVKLFHATVEKIQEDLDKELEPQEKPDPNSVILEEWAAHLSRMQRQSETLGLEEHFKLLISKFLPNDNARKNPEAKQKGTKGGRNKAA